MSTALLSEFAAVVAVAGTVRLMDDLLDGHAPGGHGRLASDASGAGDGTGMRAAYALLCLGVAASLELSLSVTLFVGAYCAGMLRRWPEAPSCWPGGASTPAWLESAVVLAAAGARFGWPPVLWGLAVMAAVDVSDDLVDRRDGLGAARGLAALGLWAAAVWLSLAHSVMVAAVAFPLILVRRPRSHGVGFPRGEAP